MNQTDIALNIKSALNPLVASRVYRLLFPQPPALPVWPAIRYTFITHNPESTWCGDTGDEGADFTVQIDVVDLESKGFTSFIALLNSVKLAMKTAVPQYHFKSQLEDFDAETKTLRAILEYSVQHSFINPP